MIKIQLPLEDFGFLHDERRGGFYFFLPLAVLEKPADLERLIKILQVRAKTEIPRIDG